MSGPMLQQDWVPGWVHRHNVKVLRGWVIALAILAVIGTLILGAVLFGTMFSASRFPVVVSAPRECRLSDDSQSPKLYIAIDITAVIDGDLSRATTIGPSGLKVEAVAVVPSLAPLSAMGDAEFRRIVEDAEEESLRFGDDEATGVVVAVVDTGGQTEGGVRGLRTRWVLGEPAAEQDLPLGIEFTPTNCTVTSAG